MSTKDISEPNQSQACGENGTVNATCANGELREESGDSLGASGQGQQLCLRFVTGKYQGGVFRLDTGSDYLIGREAEADIPLAQEVVSRRHALIRVDEAGMVWVQDLESQNGTFINGTEVVEAKLSLGQRMLVGETIMVLTTEQSGEASSSPNPFERDQTAGATLKGSISGRLEELRLDDLLRLFETSKKSGVLTIQNRAAFGRIFLRDGRVVHASVNDEPALATEAFYRMAEWEGGTFELGPRRGEEIPSEEMQQSLDSLLAEAARRQPSPSPRHFESVDAESGWREPTVQMASDELGHLMSALSLVTEINMALAARGCSKPFEIGETHLELVKIVATPCTDEVFATSITALYLIFYEGAKKSSSQYRFPPQLVSVYAGGRANMNVIGHLSDIRVFQQHNRREPRDLAEIGAVFRRYGDTEWPSSDAERQTVRRNILTAVVAHLTDVLEAASELDSADPS